MRPTVPHVIIGRSAELGVLDGFLGDAEAEPRGLLIEGEPGIGKTTVFTELLAAARARDYAVLACRPTRSEMDLSYVSLIELLSGVDDDVLRALPQPQSRVLRMILRQEEPDGQFDRLSLGVAATAALRAVARTRPVLIGVDDAQWLDQPTAATLTFVVRRLNGTAARIAVVRRSGVAVELWEELARAVRPDRLRLDPLGPSELSRILRRVLGWAPAWPRVVRIADLTGGNPLYAVELARALGTTRSGDEPEAALPDGVADLARSRIAKLPEAVRRAVELASVPRNPTPGLLEAIEPAAGLPYALAAAERNGILVTDGDRIRFAHPILAAAAYASIPTQRRRQLHRAAAAVAEDSEERARHMAVAVTGPDADVARELADAAEQAWRRGAPDAAADLLRLSVRLTPPQEAEALAWRRIAYGRLLHSAGDEPGARAELESVIAGLPFGPLRARALFHLMYVIRLSGALSAAIAAGERAVAEAEDDPSFQAEVYELLSRLSDNDIGRKLRLAQLGTEAVERAADADPYVEFHARAALVEAEFYAGLGIHLERLEGLAPPGRRFPPVRTAHNGEDLLGRLLAYAGRVDEGLATLQVMYERGLVESRSILPAVLGWMAEAHIIAGRFARAAELTREAIERAEEVGGDRGRPWETGYHAVATALLGRLDEAEFEAYQVLSRAAADPAVDHDAGPAQLAIGIIEVTRGRYEAAAAILQRLDDAKRAAGIREPRLWAHGGWHLEALIGAGEPGRAAEALSRLAFEADRSGSAWSSAIAARCEALLDAANGRLDAAAAAARRSLDLLATLDMPFERARTQFVAGQIYRRRREKKLARQAFDAALAIFADLGAAAWAERSRAELARIPLRQAAAGLTATERSIARLAVEGLTNREIADRAFLSPKTVEVNLTRIYRKLGVRSRAALAGRLAAETDDTRER